MTNSDLRELDGWIVEFFLGDAWRSKSLDRRWLINPRTKVYFQCPMFSVDPSAFALVKREVERRGWEWRSTYRTIRLPQFRFEILTEHDYSWDASYLIEAASEELAGCLAVKVAVEAISSSTPT